MKTLQELKDYADVTDNVWMQKKLDLLESEINLKVHKAKIDTYDTCIKMI
jgi:hypothetical protein